MRTDGHPDIHLPPLDKRYSPIISTICRPNKRQCRCIFGLFLVVVKNFASVHIDMMSTVHIKNYSNTILRKQMAHLVRYEVGRGPPFHMGSAERTSAGSFLVLLNNCSIRRFQTTEKT